jgi:hypothetical protein
VVDVLLLLGLEYCSGSFIFLVLFYFFGYVHQYYHLGITLLQRLGIISISRY